MKTPAWIEKMLSSLDNGDVAGFCEPLAEDCQFIFANQDPVQGRTNIAEYVEGFLGTLEDIEHEVHEVLQTPNRAVMRGRVSYFTGSDSPLEVPFVNVFEMENGAVTTYQIYVDNSEL
jgi:ketosteroid isomerase-like protein